MKSTLAALALILATTTPALASEIDIEVFMRPRCTGDDLNREQAIERNAWVQKCIEANGGTFATVTKSDLEHMKYEKDETETLVPRRRPLYASFMTDSMEVWKAPTDFTAPCELPTNVGVGGICLSH